MFLFEEFALADADVTRISLADYPLPLMDADFLASSGLPRQAVELKAMLTAHQGVFIASPEYSASVSPLLKNAIDWMSRPGERGEPSYASFKGRVFAVGSAANGAAGGVGTIVVMIVVMLVWPQLRHLRELHLQTAVSLTPEDPGPTDEPDVQPSSTGDGSTT